MRRDRCQAFVAHHGLYARKLGQSRRKILAALSAFAVGAVHIDGQTDNYQLRLFLFGYLCYLFYQRFGFFFCYNGHGRRQKFGLVADGYARSRISVIYRQDYHKIPLN